MISSAVMEGPYRYRLDRRWGVGPRVCWVMLNPSTADADQDDATISKCIGFARLWGMGALTVVNLYAWRSTDPGRLTVDRITQGRSNAKHIEEASRDAAFVVCAWGAHKAVTEWAVDDAMTELHLSTPAIKCLGLTKARHPKHPLYVPYAQPLQAYP